MVKVATPKADVDTSFVSPKLITCNKDKYMPMYLWVHTSPSQGIAINLSDGTVTKSVLSASDVVNVPEHLMECELVGSLKVRKKSTENDYV